ncbi:AI-2E family transporter [Enterococcus dongliensis]|uniref:AI-2E family transporter n=1 Tax=Enterococcus dongliensis TaxID=2559925 RepID=A0AAP5NFZ7_9ENTE|nr:AI-2E family transporter [Enterococcus dongliensis]MDT2595581.1 AI-2E family transporter [Enterococcus dongliensis]MDT2603203.1 AI-2E family transporter [Enterococcus dongliensis]MDT2613148.1 AI-2E family transporter [Enterococcus dongliensis]MDT2633566.1 AI-2E family transporter [Enterococcus dongliensis]MDT2636060.1 AI-2E family transporter [Enterococcus dongliensis]
MDKKKLAQKTSWFWKWFLNSQVVVALIIVLLLLLITLVFTKVSYLFEPVGQFFAIVGLPVVIAGILYYLMNPVINFLEKKGLNRTLAIVLLFIAVIALLIWGVVVIIPQIREQIGSMMQSLPGYFDTISDKANEIFKDPAFKPFQQHVDNSLQKILGSLTETAQNISRMTLQGLGSVVSTVATVVIALITAPIILFFLLKDGNRLAPYILNFLPTKTRKPTLKVMSEINSQLASYIRGQLTVAFSVAVMFIIGFSLVGMKYAITLGILAGFLNLVPYLGSFFAMVPVIFIAIVTGPVMLVKVIIVFVIEQTIEGRIVSPLVLGNQLKIHPITIMFVLLTAGKIFGITGIILGIPFYAVMKVVAIHVFEWYKGVSNLYEEEKKPVD